MPATESSLLLTRTTRRSATSAGDMKTQRFLVIMATDGDVEEREIGEVMDALGYRGLLVLDLEKTDHECPCLSWGCIVQLRDQGHVIAGGAACCICWALQKVKAP